MSASAVCRELVLRTAAAAPLLTALVATCWLTAKLLQRRVSKCPGEATGLWWQALKLSLPLWLLAMPASLLIYALGTCLWQIIANLPDVGN